MQATFRNVAIVGKLASLTRRQAGFELSRRNFSLRRRVTGTIAVVVVGQDEWPLDTARRVPRNLRHALELRQLGHPIEILSEAEFLARIYVDIGVRAFTAARVIELTGITRRHLRSLTRAGLFENLHTDGHVELFSFVHLRQIRHIRELMEQGIKIETFKKAFTQHLETAPDARLSLTTLRRDGKKWVFRCKSGRLMFFNRQFLLPFDEPDLDEPVESVFPVDLFERAWAAERNGEFDVAVTAYEDHLLENGANRVVCFNLGNVLFKLRRFDAASARFRQALELDPRHADAWNNLGNCLSQMGGYEYQAVTAYRRALDCNDRLADAHFNLARTLEFTGDAAGASAHWQSYLELDSTSEFADYARVRLERGNPVALS